jgi:hypothetical protein
MPRAFFLAWIVLLISFQLKAQVKQDTVREDINYRLPQSLNSERVYYKQTSLKPHVDRSFIRTSAKSNQERLDTLYEEIDYRVPPGLRKPSFNTDRSFTHYVGLQANHIIEPTGLKAPADSRNPFSLTYGVNHNHTGLGLSTAWGLQSSHTKNTQQPDAATETATDKTWFRFGLSIQGSQNPRWRLGMGVDLLLSRQTYLSKTYSNGFLMESRKDTRGHGLGPRASVQYLINHRFRIGTETCMYFEKFKNRYKEKFTGLPAEYSNTSSSDNSFYYPISVFLIARIW